MTGSQGQPVSGMHLFAAPQITPADQFAVIASDGLWNVMSSEEVVQFVLEAKAEPRHAGASPTQGPPTKWHDRLPGSYLFTRSVSQIVSTSDVFCGGK